MLFDKVPARALLAVYPSPELARRVADDLRGLGVGDDEIRVDHPADETTSLAAEVQEEATEAFVSPQAGIVYPKETVKASLALGPPMVVVGAVLGVVLTVVVGPASWGVWLRILVGAISGGVMGGAIASIVVPAMAVRNPLDPLPAEAGVTLRVQRWSEDIERLLVESSPLRLDRLGGRGQPLGTVITEEQSREGGIIEEVAQNFDREGRADPEDRTR